MDEIINNDTFMRSFFHLEHLGLECKVKLLSFLLSERTVCVYIHGCVFLKVCVSVSSMFGCHVYTGGVNVRMQHVQLNFRVHP